MPMINSNDSAYQSFRDRAPSWASISPEIRPVFGTSRNSPLSPRPQSSIQLEGLSPRSLISGSIQSMPSDSSGFSIGPPIVTDSNPAGLDYPSIFTDNPNISLDFFDRRSSLAESEVQNAKKCEATEIEQQEFIRRVEQDSMSYDIL